MERRLVHGILGFKSSYALKLTFYMRAKEGTSDCKRVGISGF